MLKDEKVSFTYPSYFEEIARANELYNSDIYKESGRYWRNKIKEKPQNILKKKQVESSVQQQKSANYFVNISEDADKLFKEMAIATRLSLQQLTTAALLIYFGKTTTETEFTFGIPGHGRSLEKQKSTVGMFSGVLPFKCVYKPDLTLSELLAAFRVSRKEDYPHRNYLVSDLIRSFNISISESYLSDVVINYVPFNFDLDYGHQVKASTLRIMSENERTPLQVFWREYGKDKSLTLGMHYRLDYFDEPKIKLLSERLIYILQQFPAALNRVIGSISIIPPAEKQVLKKFNNTVNESLPVKAGMTIVSAFEEQVRFTPGLVAVRYENNYVTFEELNRRANQLAHYLRAKGVIIETLVPICIERGVELIIGIIGVLKAGAAYVPIDPEYPQERIRLILNDVNSSIILTSEYGKTRIGSKTNVEFVLIDTGWSVIGRQPATDPAVCICPENLAYVIYTSGSIGEPKGAMIEHMSYININNCYHNILPGEQTILTCNYVFDVSVLEILSSMLSGGCLNIPPLDITTNTSAYAEYLCSRKISTAYIHPMSLEEVAGILAKHKQCYLTKILIGVEPIRKEAVRWYLEQGIKILNGYGPTETTICATFFPVNEEGIAYEILPIGKPVKNVQVFIANNFEVSPIGIVGEILIGGVGLARGYLNRNGITSEKFIGNIFNKGSSRLYKTGDLGRWLPDGNIEYLGRIDNQVKIRGYRIEPGEIENTLMQSKLIKQCAVVAKEYNATDKRLVAYIVSEENFDKEVVVTYLQNKLPQYMIPTIWVNMERFPLTFTGKIDRKELPEPVPSNIPNNEFIAPRNPLEATLATMWKKLLYIERVSINDNFFLIGGHSLLAVQLMNLILEETGKSIQVCDLVKNPTIEKLAKIITSLKKENNYKYLIPIKTGGENIPLYIVCGPSGTGLLFYKFATLLDACQPVYALQQPIALPDKQEDVVTSIEEVAARYIEEITLDNPTGPYVLSGHCMGGIIAFEMAKQLKLKGKIVKLLAMFDSIIPKEKQHQLLNNDDKLNYTALLKESLGKVYSKLDFELYLLIKHTRHAFDYKINSLKSVIKRAFRYKKSGFNSYTLEEKSSQEFKKVLSNYNLGNYDGHVLLFFAKDHYRFADKNRKIFYKRFSLEENTKNRWKDHAASVGIYEVDGEHSTIFEDKQALEFAAILQEHLNNCNR